MTEIFAHPDPTHLAHCRSILEEAGIACVIRHEGASDLVAGLPDPMRQPYLCVENDADAERARELLREVEAPAGDEAEEWTCLKCGEVVPGNFGSCWKCEAPRPGTQG